MTLWQHISASLALVLLVASMVALDRLSCRQTEEVSCTAINVEMTGEDYGLVNEADVKRIVDRACDYCVGQKLNSIDLAGIERTLDFRGEVSGSEAYTTKDGVLHVRVERRTPIVKFVTMEGIRLYADADGFLFPALKDSSKPLPTIEGSIPLQEGDNSGNAWLKGVVGLFVQISGSKVWKNGISSVTTDTEGNLTLRPKSGQECFLIGQPTGVAGKLARMEDYYKYIAPTADYNVVDLRYKGQIVCASNQ